MGDDFTYWCLIAGGLLVVMALAGTVVERLPLTPAVLYLAVGFALGPSGVGLIRTDPLRDAPLLERLTEVAVLLSLFSAGLKLRVPFSDGRWRAPVQLATVGMVVTAGLVAAAGVWGLGLSLGAAVLLGAVLAPTDPVLASDVQVTDPDDRDRLRVALTGEAGLNDGTAFPFVMLGLGLLGAHHLGAGGWRWWAVDLAWATAAGLAVGAALGTVVGRVALWLRGRGHHRAGADEFLALGLIALSYGAALLIHAYGFLAVFAAGLSLRRAERAADAPDAGEKVIDPVLGFNERVERIAEVALVVVVGGMLSGMSVPAEALWFVPLLLLAIRPAAAVAGVAGTRLSGPQRRRVAWFGIRGIGSVYYLTFAITHGLGGPEAARVASLVLVAVAASVVAHGVSVTPVMNAYTGLRRRGVTPPA